MHASYRSLILRLLEKRVDPDEIPTLVRDLVWIFGRGGLFTVNKINERLEELGWPGDLIDELSFRYIGEIVQNEFGSRLKYYHLSCN